MVSLALAYLVEYFFSAHCVSNYMVDFLATALDFFLFCL